MHPLVSVVIPVYNRENTIMRAIDSVLRQTYHNIEVIVVDDCSVDSTKQIVSSYNDPRVSLVSLAYNSGANVARNKGIERAKGEFIAFQDSDDEWMVDKLEKQINYMIETGIVASYHPYILYENNKYQIMPHKYKDYNVCEYHLAETLKQGNVVGTPTLVIRRSVLSVIGVFDEEMERMQDYEFVLRLIKKFKLGYISEPLVNVYRMEKSISTNNKVMADSCIKILDKHIDFIDLESILGHYFTYCEFSERGELRWDNFSRVLNIIKKYDRPDLEKEYYRVGMQYLYGQYDLIRNVLINWYQFFKNYIKTSGFAIYGAGVYGRKAYEELKKENYIPKYFLVTERSEMKDIDGIPIISLASCTEQEIPVIIAVSWEIQMDLIQNLFDKGINKFCVYPFCC